MKLIVDRNSDALYFRLDDSAVAESEEVAPGVVLDFNVEGSVVGSEMRGLRARVAPEQLRTLRFET